MMSATAWRGSIAGSGGTQKLDYCLDRQILPRAFKSLLYKLLQYGIL